MFWFAALVHFQQSKFQKKKKIEELIFSTCRTGQSLELVHAHFIVLLVDLEYH